MAQRLYLPIEQVFSGLGAIGAGFKLNTYETGTSTPKATYSDTALSVANTNPIVADSAGRLGDIFVDNLATYKLVLTDADDNIIWTADPADPKVFTLNDFDPRPTSFWGTTAGTSTVYTLDADPDVSAYSSTQTFYFSCHLDNDPGATMSIDGLTALTLKKYDGAGSKYDLQPGDLQAGQTYHARIDGTDIVILGKDQATTSSQGISYLPEQITITNNSTDSNHDIDFSAGSVMLSDGSSRILVTAETKRIDANWAAGSGNGGLAEGLTVANDTSYQLFVIANSNNEFVGFGFDTSLTAGNLLAGANVIAAGGTKYARIGTILTNGSANIDNNYLALIFPDKQIVKYNYNNLLTTTSTIPLDNTIPQSSEGLQVMESTIFPISENSLLKIEALACVSTNSAQNSTIALFLNSGTSAIAAAASGRDASETPFQPQIRFTQTSGSTSGLTFKVRVGNASGGTLTFNGRTSAALYGGVSASSIVITEYL